MNTRNAKYPWSALLVAILLTGTELLFGGGRAAAAPAASRWGADYFPNVPLVNQDGQTLHFYDDVIKGRVVALNFIFTSCEDSCPMETAKLRQVQEVLGDRVGRDVFMYSITIDPARDTPAALKKYAEKFHVKPGWQFLTGTKADINLLRTKLGLFREQIPEEDLGDHNLSLIVGNEATGQWMKRSPFDNPKILARVLGDQLHNFAVRNVAMKSYAEAKPLPAFSRGEYLFRGRCSSCHSIGGGDSMGPDLLGVVAQRDRAWLVRWLKRPDQMLAEQDPIAVALFAKFKELPMPNLQLNDIEVTDLIEYLESETNRITKVKSAAEPATAARPTGTAEGGG
jgi:protein SCO1/2